MKKIAISLKLLALIISVFFSFNSFSQTETFTSNGTFVVPAGVYQVTVQAWGAGGSGSRITSNNRRGGGGGGGAYARSIVPVTPLASYAVVVGTGGSNTSGGESSFDTNRVVAAGGSRGFSNSTNAGAGGTVAASTGTIRRAGGNGADGGTTSSGGGGGGAGSTQNGGNASGATGGTGGNSNGGNGGNGVTGNANGYSGNAVGGGGSGGSKDNDSNRNGGSGADGQIVISWVLESEIDVTGLGYSIPGDLSNVPILIDNTDFGTAQIISETITKTFVIHNIGSADLILGTTSISGSTNFTLNSAPASGTVIAPGGSQNVIISFSATTIGVRNGLLTIASNDADEASYRINLKAEANKVFFDSDGDGIYDDVDLDDDNDGIPDYIEEQNCRKSSGASQADYKFLNETFGTGVGRGTGISSLYDVTTTYCFEDGVSGSPFPCHAQTGPDLNDGKFTVASHITSGISGESVNPNGALANWAWYAWAPIEDHTPGDTDGRMAIFNAAEDPGIFYETKIKGTLANVPVTYSFWVINIDNGDPRFIAKEGASSVPRNKPNITVNFLTLDRNTVIATFNTKDITRCPGAINDPNDPAYNPLDPNFNSCITSEWKQFSQQFTTTETAFIVQFVNNAPGGGGNDLAIDDIEVRQTLCDSDGDGIADVFDLDSDNDGIPDAVEARPEIAELTEGKGHLTGVSTWIDTNNNGIHDVAEGYTPIPIDTDGDGIPDYLDLDSDNDGIFDVDEYGVVSSNAPPGFQNGDGDINGNGTGNGLDTEAFREKDSDGKGITYYGDGILDIYDFHNATPGSQTYINSYGNVGQGTPPLYALDSDGDGIPDYKDPYNDLTGIYDIDTVEIYKHLAHTNGILDDTTDVDGDGIMASRDGDDTVFGSPRNLDSSYSLYFDGRNDYVEDANIIASGDATLMAFIKSGGANTNSNNQIIAGQNDFHIRVNTNNTITAIAEGVSLTSTSTASLGVWMHVAVTTTSGSTVLYINGVEEANNTNGGITSTSNFMIGRATTNTNYFKGEIDEVRVFNKALTSVELKRMVYQELDEANNFNKGKILPDDISASIGTNLVKYYKMDAYKDDILDDKKTPSIDLAGAKMYNFKDIYFQRAPLPYITKADGDWTDSASWGATLPDGSTVNGNEWDIMTKKDKTDDASIVHIKHNINLNGAYDTQGTVGIIVDAGKKFFVEADKGLYNSWYLKLNGLIDLEGESQLIQTEGSVLDVASAGRIERDQQGTKDLYTYNYWSSPVGLVSTTNNNVNYRVPLILKNGTIPANPTNITFLTSGYDGSVVGNDIRIADYWIWKYANKPNNSYNDWIHIRSTAFISIGEGFTMKGVFNTNGDMTQIQNYVFDGKPNNGDFTLSISKDNEYLIGNPYPSAMDANEFIKDNIKDGLGKNINNVINGALYFWEHFASKTHVLAEYQGGYGIYTLMGSTPAFTSDTRINVSGSLASLKGAPQRYIPVGQGFFVSAISDPALTLATNNPNLTSSIDGGNIIFKNSQRIFIKESPSTSIFIKNSNTKGKQTTSTDANLDVRQKIRIKFDSPKGYHRQLLVGVDENASNNFDIGYDAPLNEDNNEDMFWIFNNSNFIIQAVNNFDAEQTFPLGVKISKQGLATIKIDELENIDSNQTIYLHDKQLNTYHNLKDSNYQVLLAPGKHLNRFEVTFKNAASLNTETMETKLLQVYFSNDIRSFIIHNPDLRTIESAEVLNVLGQSIFSFKVNKNETYIEQKIEHLASGAYIIKLKTDSGIISKKVLIE